MLAPSSPALKEFHRLDKSSSEFQGQLAGLLSGKKYNECVSSLEGDDLVWLVDYLDKAFGRLDPSSTASQKCLRELRTICDARAILPTSCNLDPALLKVISGPVASDDCDVYEGTYRGSPVCVKHVPTDTNPQTVAKPLYQEAAIWKHLRHKNIAPFKGVTTVPLFISDWMHGGSLMEYIKNNPNADQLELLSDIADGLSYLHSRNVIHGNLRASNIFVDANGHARITDFRLAAVSSDSGATSKESDIFSFAMVMIEVLTGTTPLGNTQPAVVPKRGERPPRPTNPDITGGLWRLIKRCWHEDPHLRPTAWEVLRILLEIEPPAWRRLIDPTISADERIALIEYIFSDRDEVEVFKYLSEHDAQAFVHVIGEALENMYYLRLDVRRRFLRSSYWICRREALLPEPLQIPLCYESGDNPDFKGGLADVWKGKLGNLHVAAKALRISKTSDLVQVRKWFFKEVLIWKSLHHANVLPLLGVTMTKNPDRFIMVTQWMENGNINQFLKEHPDANRVKLLQEVTQGLIYLHDRGVVHGDLKGDNILIDKDKRAILADFSLISLIPDQQSFASTCLEGGTVRWMSPELMDPESYGLKRSCPTAKSDCYALGMVIYEILSERPPYDTVNSFAILRKVLAKERPDRPEGEAGERITDGIWDAVELCWKHEPGERPDAKTVLVALGGKPDQPDASGGVATDGETDDDDQSDGTTEFADCKQS